MADRKTFGLRGIICICFILLCVFSTKKGIHQLHNRHRLHFLEITLFTAIDRLLEQLKHSRSRAGGGLYRLAFLDVNTGRKNTFQQFGRPPSKTIARTTNWASLFNRNLGNIRAEDISLSSDPV